MSLKTVFVVVMISVCCHCSEVVNGTLDEGRAKKKKNGLRLWGMLIMMVLAKVAVGKLVSMLFFWGLFQKFCYIIGLLLNYFMLNKKEIKPTTEPTSGDYNTLGYSYGPPDNSFMNPETFGAALSSSYGTPTNWPYKRRSLDEN